MKKKVDRSIPYAQRLNAERRKREVINENFNNALMQDAMLLACNEILGVGKGRVVPLCNAFVEWHSKLVKLIGNDYGEDKSVVYSRAKIDELMAPIYGNAMIPFEIRYGMVNIPPNTIINVDEKGNKLYPDMGVFIPENMAPENGNVQRA